MNRFCLLLTICFIPSHGLALAQSAAPPMDTVAASPSLESRDSGGPMRDPIRYPLDRFRSWPAKFEWAWRRATERGPQPLGEVVRRNQKGCPSYDPSSTEVCTFGLAGEYGASGYCWSIGERLATLHEIALGLNPDGVSETPKPGFRPVYQRSGKIAFYYNPSTYSHEKAISLARSGGLTLEELKTYKIWTASAPNYTGGFFYSFVPNWPEQIHLQEAGYARHDEAVIRCTKTRI